MMVEAIDAGGVHLVVWGKARAADRFGVEGAYRQLLLARLTEAGVEPVTASRVSLVNGSQARVLDET
jgi:hypothetical protein